MTSETTPRAPMDPDEAVAVLRHFASTEAQAKAAETLSAQLVTLTTRQQAALDVAATWEHKAWADGGDHVVRAIVRELREALGAPRP